MELNSAPVEVYQTIAQPDEVQIEFGPILSDTNIHQVPKIFASSRSSDAPKRCSFGTSPVRAKMNPSTSCENFGNLMNVRVREDWSEFNLNFIELSNRLVSVKQQFMMKRAVSNGTMTVETRTFAEILDLQVEKIVLFYLRQQGELANRLWKLREKQFSRLQGGPLTIEEVEESCSAYRELGQCVLDLLEYLDVNVIALRRILSKHDKQFNSQMSQLYFDARLGSSNKTSQLLQLYHQEGLRAIIETIRRGFEELYEAQEAILSGYCAPDDTSFYISGPSSGRGDRSTCPVSAKVAIVHTPYITRVRSFSSLTVMDLGAEEDSLYKDLESRVKGRQQGLDTLSMNTMVNRGPGLRPGGVGRGEVGGGGGDYLNSMSPSLPLLSQHSLGNIQSYQSTALTAAASSAGLGGGGGGRGGADRVSVGMGSTLRRRAESVSQFEPVLQRINEAADRVLQSQEQTTAEYLASHSTMAPWLRISDMNRDDEEDDEAESELLIKLTQGRRGAEKSSVVPLLPETKKEKRSTSRLGLYINLLVCFLYQANQYVVAPTSGQYASRLGMTPSMNGAIVGMSPLAALVSALVFSAWSNYSFKKPLIVSLVFLSVGNLLYAMALQFDSPALIFTGRIITGLGGPRGIVRRYIADHVSLADRTEASSNFVTAGALGLAFGPLLSSLISESALMFQVKWGDTFVLIQYETITAPGWIMTVLFTACLVVVMVFFTEPHSLLIHHNSHKEESHHLSQRTSWCQACTNWFTSPFGATTQTHRREAEGVELKSSNTSRQADVEEPFTSVADFSVVSAVVDDDDWTLHIADGFDRKVESSGNESLTMSEPSLSSAVPDNSTNITATSNSVSQRGGKRLSISPNKVIAPPGPRSSPGAAPAAGGLASDGGPSPAPVLLKVREDESRWGPRSLTESTSSHDELASESLLRAYDQAIRDRDSSHASTNCWHHISSEVALILFIYFINKIGQELVVTSVPTLCSSMFSWSAQTNGFFMAALGALVLPATIVVSRVAKNSEDRVLMNVLNGVSVLCIALILRTAWLPYSITQYVVGACGLFASLNALEGVIMSLLSKLVSPELARGTFNSGLLSTEAGTLGRVVGDMAITAVGAFAPLVALDLLFGPLALGLGVSIAATYYYYDSLSI